MPRGQEGWNRIIVTGIWMYCTLWWETVKHEGNNATVLYIKGAKEIFSKLSSQIYLVEMYFLLQFLMVGIWSHSSSKEGLVVSCWKYTECLPFSKTGPQQQVDSSSALHGFLHRLPLPCHFPLHTFQSLAVCFHLQLHLLSTWLYLPLSLLPSMLLFSYDCEVPALHLFD